MPEPPFQKLVRKFFKACIGYKSTDVVMAATCILHMASKKHRKNFTIEFSSRCLRVSARRSEPNEPVGKGRLTIGREASANRLQARHRWRTEGNRNNDLRSQVSAPFEDKSAPILRAWSEGGSGKRQGKR